MGTSVNILGSFDSVEELPVAASLGDAYLIDGNLYVWNDTEFINAGNIKGPQGEPGKGLDITINGNEPDEEGNFQLDYTTQEDIDMFKDTDLDGTDPIHGLMFVDNQLRFLTPDGEIINVHGQKGKQGEIGPQGPRGEKGEQGIPGEKGDKGDIAEITATKEEAENGVVNDKYMTPLRTKEAIDKKLTNPRFNSLVVGAVENNASGLYSAAFGNRTEAAGLYSAAFGINTKASGYGSAAFGNSAEASGSYSVTFGTVTKASEDNSAAFGKYSKTMVSGDALVLGNGTGHNYKSNAFRIQFDGSVYGVGAFNSTGADYAEFFEWKDGNPNNEDRVGFVVSLIGDKIQKATKNDSYILGIVSATPSVIGDSYQDDWNGRYLLDEWGRIQYEWRDVVVENQGDPDTENSTTTVSREYLPILNPDWDNTEEYIPRNKRKEWSPIGLVGKLYVRDNGTCEVDGFAKVSDEEGILEKSETETNMRVIERVNSNVVRVFIK